MDIATIIGLISGIGLVVGSIFMGGSGLMPFVNVPSLMIVVGGSVAAIMINFPLKDCLGVFSIVLKCFLVKLPTSDELITKFKELATIARRDGLLSLESHVESIEDDFLKRGLEMVVSGTSKDDLTLVLETELTYIEQRHQIGKQIIEAVAAAAPAFGMIGTLIGLVQMLRALDDPSTIGVGMATALLTTFYGAVIANLFCLPLAGKLGARNQEEVMTRELMLAGLTALTDGLPPAAVQDRLVCYVSPKSRPDAA